MITVTFQRTYKGIPYEITMNFTDLETVETLGQIIQQVEAFIDTQYEVYEGLQVVEGNTVLQEEKEDRDS